MSQVKYMSDGFIYLTADGDTYGWTDAGSRLWLDVDYLYPDDYDEYVSFIEIGDPRTSREVEDDPC